jgi:hypothetical protein
MEAACRGGITMKSRQTSRRMCPDLRYVIHHTFFRRALNLLNPASDFLWICSPKQPPGRIIHILPQASMIVRSGKPATAFWTIQTN